uniref:[FeFe] hydrogenase H-cluster maturation GTPase HydF n=1 Tax=Eubacterium cellulosolvens TaxID=29322 RepID=UPI0004833711|nr:[FeFe] hydrogenase H-cluster maturation GTPase HydF [[Eubacterium] cellulosolvens]
MSELYNKASSANRTHIGLFGRMNAGKSTLLNALTDQTVSIVSSRAGTTTDVVRKPMEIHGIGACTFLDTAGIDDSGEIGELRVKAAGKAAAQTDIAVMVFYDRDDSLERQWTEEFRKRKVPVVGVLGHADELGREAAWERAAKLEKILGIPVIPFADKWEGCAEEIRKALVEAAAGRGERRTITGNLVKAGDSVILVMPQDPQAPEGRLIQPEVQTIRELLDKHCIVHCTAAEELPALLASLKEEPELVITDSQIFREVHDLLPAGVKLTSFSILFAGFKGDMRYFADSAKKIEELTEDSRVLIAECCTHAPMEEDIGRVKIPRLLRKAVGEKVTVDVKAGTDFPEDAGKYDLIIQCGSCMFNRRYVISRVEQAKRQGVPMTNYGIAIAQLTGILDEVTLP